MADGSGPPREAPAVPWTVVIHAFLLAGKVPELIALHTVLTSATNLDLAQQVLLNVHGFYSLRRGSSAGNLYFTSVQYALLALLALVPWLKLGGTTRARDTAWSKALRTGVCATVLATQLVWIEPAVAGFTDERMRATSFEDPALVRALLSQLGLVYNAVLIQIGCLAIGAMHVLRHHYGGLADQHDAYVAATRNADLQKRRKEYDRARVSVRSRTQTQSAAATS
eukprot:Clim_evm31s214 gene=Clim_evmTU31s214